VCRSGVRRSEDGPGWPASRPGTPLLAIVPEDQMWVEASFKETQLGSVRIGQPATVHSDFYKGAVVYHGRVVGILSGTGDVFQLSPGARSGYSRF
jgi:membrane fusion protein, multidrug efflux system